MTSQLIRRLFLGIWLLCIGCSSQEPLPANTWSKGCIELGPYQQGYRISGLCCEYLTLPAINLDRQRSFSVKATYYTYTGAGFAAVPTLISGQLSADERVLGVSYSVNAVKTTHTFELGRATTYCMCGCD